MRGSRRRSRPRIILGKRRRCRTKLHIAAAIEKAQTKRAERCELTADWVVEGAAQARRANMADYMKSTPEGLSVVDFSGLTRDQTAALSQVTVEDVAGGKRVQFKLHDKRAAAPARIAYPGARCG